MPFSDFQRSHHSTGRFRSEHPLGLADDTIDLLIRADTACDAARHTCAESRMLLWRLRRD